MRILTWVQSIPRLGLSAPVAQLDRALVSGTRGRRFESSRAYFHPAEFIGSIKDFASRSSARKSSL